MELHHLENYDANVLYETPTRLSSTASSVICLTEDHNASIMVFEFCNSDQQDNTGIKWTVHYLLIPN